MSRPYLGLAAIVLCAVLLFGNEVIATQQGVKPKSAEEPAQQPPFPVEQEAAEGFSDEPEGDRPVGTPLDPEQDLNASFPQPGSVLKWVMPPEWFQFKKDVFAMRLGNQFSSSVYDNFRFKDGRTSFTAAPYTLPVSSIPTGPPGLAANFEW
jgi:hypothetical protein